MYLRQRNYSPLLINIATFPYGVTQRKVIVMCVYVYTEINIYLCEYVCDQLRMSYNPLAVEYGGRYKNITGDIYMYMFISIHLYIDEHIFVCIYVNI
jgi:hypothetical protein